MFTKKDLRNGDVCVQRNGDVMIYIECFNGVFVHKGGYDTVNGWNDNLCDSDIYCAATYPDIDIMKVYRPKEPYQCQFLKGAYTKGELVFDRERDNKPILDKEEREYLSAVIKPFKDSICDVAKMPINYQEYIRIVLKNLDVMLFPKFPEGTMYKNMEPEKHYTLKELGL